ncbi:MAG: bifunctional riboflavin kinase/FAD synthetase [Bacteroidia bacterium]|nr:bifunctional riboflavin kinase/FAD synthetase [Bacteroidia bacterium]
MKVSGLEGFSAINPVITIGMFDGVHRGHQQIISRLIEIAGQLKGESVIMSFEPHPRLFFDPSAPDFKLLTTTSEKISILEKTGIDHFILCPFNAELSQMSSFEFIRDVLVGRMKIKSLVAGYNHHFGRNREGTFEDIIGFAQQFGFGVEKIGPFSFGSITISSSLIRSILEKGDIIQANNYLGQQYRINGNVVEGNKIGRTIGYPTANIHLEDSHKLIPCCGVYAVDVLSVNRMYKGVLNIGHRPTIENTGKLYIEVHIFDFSQDIYGQEITVFLKAKIRDEKKFGNLTELKEQITRDSEIAGKL